MFRKYFQDLKKFVKFTPILFSCILWVYLSSDCDGCVTNENAIYRGQSVTKKGFDFITGGSDPNRSVPQTDHSVCPIRNCTFVRSDRIVQSRIPPCLDPWKHFVSVVIPLKWQIFTNQLCFYLLLFGRIDKNSILVAIIFHNIETQ